MLKPKASNRTKSLVKWGGYSFEVWQNGDKNISYSSFIISDCRYMEDSYLLHYFVSIF